MARRWWTCPACKRKNDRVGGRRSCSYCKEGRAPKARVQVHARTLRDDSYAEYCRIAELVHGVRDESCCVCGKPRSQERRHDRDHDHKTGLPRGLACGGNQGCNVLMLPWVSASVARGIAEAKRLAGEADAERWALIAAYLSRVEEFYREADAA